MLLPDPIPPVRPTNGTGAESVSAAPPASVLRIRRRSVGVGGSFSYLLNLGDQFSLGLSYLGLNFDFSSSFSFHLSLGSSFSLNLVRLRYYVSFSGGLGWRGGSEQLIIDDRNNKVGWSFDCGVLFGELEVAGVGREDLTFDALDGER